METRGDEMAQVLTMSPDDLRELVGELVEQKLNELLGDPEAVLDLDEGVRQRLKASLASRGDERPAAEVAAELGLTW